MPYPYVWAALVLAQTVFLVLVAMLWLTRLDRATLSPLVAEGLECLVRDDAELERLIGQARSQFWWRRLRAAELMARVGEERDRHFIWDLLVDPHPAVRVMATECLRQYADLDLIGQLVAQLPSQPPILRAYKTAMLKHHESLTIPVLRERLRAGVPAQDLPVYIDVIGQLGAGALMDVVTELSTHTDRDVRTAVARALRSMRWGQSQARMVKLMAMLRDPEWQVRAQAARGLATIPGPQVVLALTRALRDVSWWVRFRAGLALASHGDAGRKALSDASQMQDRYGRDMAVFVSRLSADSIAYLSADS